MLHRSSLVVGAALCAAFLIFSTADTASSQADRCAITLAPGEDVAGALRTASAGDGVCLRPGEYQPVMLDSTIAAGVTLRGAGRGVTIEAPDGVALAFVDAHRLTVANLALRAPEGTAARIAGGAVILRDVRVEESALAVLVEGGATLGLLDVTVRRALDAGIVVRGRSRLTAERLVLIQAETGIAMLGDGSDAVVRASRIAGGAGPAIFLGRPGCGEPVLGSTVAPACYHERPDELTGEAAIRLDGVAIEDGDGPGVVLHPGARAEILRSQVYGRALGGLFAWGAGVTVSDSVFDGNTGFGLELRAFPEPESTRGVPATGTIERTVVRFTRPLGGGLLGDGIVVRRSSLRLVDSGVIANAGSGVAVLSGSVAEVTRTRVQENQGSALCMAEGATATLADSPLSANGTDALVPCG